MSSFCTSNTSLTDSDINTIYGNNVTHGLLPSDPYTSADRESNGLLKDATLDTIVKSMVSRRIIPMLGANDNPQQIKEKQQAFLNNIKNEYCFYEARYKYSLEKLLNSIQQGYINNNGNIQETTKTYLQYTQRLNQRVNDLTQIVNKITSVLLAANSNIEKDMDNFNKTIQDKQAKLQEQNKILSSQQSTMLLNKEMVKFTEEKGRYTNNLLKLYGFMNIVALGLLIYVYRSAAS